ncbi:CATRA conflict system CASPASE/TPR repeat-associated protein [Parafrankia sp. EUN1f]|uniref:CATRA conflict system CASPASE/TPR repeat-associated protein n=1 Tax=Parafrankia sp. EUN1f TaxID=102897 RepID=UPI0001C463C4|nr:CATRA conflict system CASPASE/TPR repeat-associated protein [Parafrankia sp. EUN1f]EFC81260.1 hypothetical protein FrEUN1fDRAFT_5601 [Parafrankia sp. EUN1f]
MTRILDQQFVAHVYLPLDGPGAAAAYRALREIWRGCRGLFAMTEPIAGLSLPPDLPADPGQLRVGAEIALAAQERPAGECQAIVRRHHEVLNLSVALTSSSSGRSWWAEGDRLWHALAAEHMPHMLGETRLFLARLDTEAVPAVREADPTLFQELTAALPADARGWPGARRGVTVASTVAVWETTPEPDERSRRDWLLAFGPDSDAAASALAWSRGDTAIPPLARYLLHAAALRYQLRVWQRDGQSRQLHDTLDALGAELRRLGAQGQAQTDVLRLRALDAVLAVSELRALRRSVDIIGDNLGRARELVEPGIGGPFADDADLARSLVERLDDQIAYLDAATESADTAVRLRTGTPTMPIMGDEPPAGRSSPRPPVPRQRPLPEPVSHLPDGHRARNVFVVHGRDEEARLAIFELLRALGLRPLDWEELVAMTGRTAPYLGEVVAQAMPLAQAVVVLMTPEDVVALHPDLRGASEAAAGSEMQARPNVLLELGMALAIHPDRTLIVTIGTHRPVTDLGGRNYVHIQAGSDFRGKIASRLRLAGCPVATGPDDDWRNAGDFSRLAAHARVP